MGLARASRTGIRDYWDLARFKIDGVDEATARLYYLDREQMTWPLSQLERAFPAPTGPSGSVDWHERAAAVSAK
jgi:hypothetical protein